jgi:hypothetical protein
MARTFGPACPWKGTRWHRSLAKACHPVINHVWEILVKNWEHHLNCTNSLGCHFLVPDYPLELDYFHCHVTMFISQSRRYWIASSSFQVCLTGMPRTAWTRVGFHQDHQALKPGKNMSDQLSHPKFTCFNYHVFHSISACHIRHISQQTQLQLWPSSAGNPLMGCFELPFSKFIGHESARTWTKSKATMKQHVVLFPNEHVVADCPFSRWNEFGQQSQAANGSYHH